MPRKEQSKKRRASRNGASAPRGLATIDRALKKIERQVGEYNGSDAAQRAMEALILAVPLRGNTASWKSDIKEALIRDRGEDDRKYVTEAVKSGKPGIYVKATYLVDYWQFEADLMLIHGGRFGGTEHTGQVIVVEKSDVVVSKAVAIDGNMEEFPVKDAADAIIRAYAFGERTSNPWYEDQKSRRRY